MQLTNGIYLISTIATNPWGERWVQRNTNEDRTLLPKPIAVQPNIDTIPAQVCRIQLKKIICIWFLKKDSYLLYPE